MLQLREYQRQAVDAVFREWESVPSTLVVAPTGCGKTILMCEIVRRVFPRRTMILAHREELIFQAQDKVERFSGVPADIEMADHRAEEDQVFYARPRVVVSSIQTQNAGGDGMGRMGKFDPWRFGFLIIDEAHHATAKSYRRVIDYYRQNEDLRVLGVTATPDRADEEALGQIYDTVAFDYEILDAINDGFLVPIQQRMVEVERLDFSKIETTAGDLNGAQLARVMEFEAVLHQVVTPTVEIAGDRRTLVFASSVAHAERMADIFNRHRPDRAGWICGKTPKDERRRALRDFADGRLQFMVNVGCLTEGFDDPGVELIAVGRPTKSRSLYAQMVGRGTRPLPGVVDGLDTPDERKAAIAASAKPHLEVLDFVGNAGQHKLMTTADILGGRLSEDVVEMATYRARELGIPVPMADLLSEIEQEERERLRRKAAEEARRTRLKAQAEWQAKTVNPFDVLQITPRAERGWERGKQLSEKQRAVLLKQGIDPDGRPYHECKQVLDEIFGRWDRGLCSFKQANVLKRYGYPPDLSRSDAHTVLDALARNRWKPVNLEEVLGHAHDTVPF